MAQSRVPGIAHAAVDENAAEWQHAQWGAVGTFQPHVTLVQELAPANDGFARRVGRGGRDTVGGDLNKAEVAKASATSHGLDPSDLHGGRAASCVLSQLALSCEQATPARRRPVLAV